MLLLKCSTVSIFQLFHPVIHRTHVPLLVQPLALLLTFSFWVINRSASVLNLAALQHTVSYFMSFFLCDSDLEISSLQATRTLTILAQCSLLPCCPTDKCSAGFLYSGPLAH